MESPKHFNDFNWGNLTGNMKGRLIQEICENEGQYECDFGVEEGDVVVDLGASLGIFSWEIQHKKPSKIICSEPSYEFLPILTENMSKTNIPHEICPKGIWDVSGENNIFAFNLDGQTYNTKNIPNKTFPTMRWMDFVKEYNIDKIDFLKFDCEGGEWDVFSDENIWWIKNNVRKMSGEFHLNKHDWKERFKIFYRTYLRLFPNFNIYAVDMVDIKWELNEKKLNSFVDYYKQVIVNIDNR